jgi:hypothetical protein
MTPGYPPSPTKKERKRIEEEKKQAEREKVGGELGDVLGGPSFKD